MRLVVLSRGRFRKYNVLRFGRAVRVPAECASVGAICPFFCLCRISGVCCGANDDTEARILKKRLQGRGHLHSGAAVQRSSLPCQRRHHLGRFSGVWHDLFRDKPFGLPELEGRFSQLTAKLVMSLPLCRYRHNGKEFADHARVSAAPGADFLLPRSHHSRERGPTGRTNGLVRGYLPKGTDLPRKWRTPGPGPCRTA